MTTKATKTAKTTASAAPAAATAPAPEAEEQDWEPADPDAVAADFADYEESALERKAKGAMVKMDKPGKYVWRVMPPKRGGPLVKRVWVHNVNAEKLREALKIFAALEDTERFELAMALGIEDVTVPPARKGFKGFICPNKTADGECLFCVVSGALGKLGRSDDDAKELSRELRSREEFFVNAVRMDREEDKKKGVRILQIVQGVYETMMKIFKDKDAGGDFSHPDTGFNLVIERKGTERDDTEYTCLPARAASVIEDRKWLSQLHDLSKARSGLETAEMRKLIAKPVAPDPIPEGRRLAAKEDRNHDAVDAEHEPAGN